MTIKKLANHPYAQAQIEYHDDGTVILRSYKTAVIICNPAGWLECTGIYSMTTIKHIGYFMHEMNWGDYYTAKNLYLKGLKYNIFTGEIKDI